MPRRPRTRDAALTPAGRRRARAAAHATAAALVAATLAGCGSATVAELPPAAEAARAPGVVATPAGETISLPARPLGVAISEDTHTAVVTLQSSRHWVRVDLTLRTITGDDGQPTTPEQTSIPASPAATGPVAGLHVAPDLGRSTFRDGTLTAEVLPRERILRILDVKTGAVLSEQPAGVGPTHVACAPQGPCFVLDTEGDALLVFRVGPGGRDLQLTRRVYVAGAPYGVALDPQRRRLWLTLTGRNELVELGAHGRPHILQRLPTVHQPDAVAVDPRTGDVVVVGQRPSLLQVIPNPASADR